MDDAEILKHRTRFLPYGCAVTDHETLAFAHSLIAATREECAEVCEDVKSIVGAHCAARIRALATAQPSEKKPCE